jgi:hypothetical protein
MLPVEAVRDAKSRHPVPPSQPRPDCAECGGDDNTLFGDGMVTLNSALGRHEDPALHCPLPPVGSGSQITRIIGNC